MRNVEYIHSRKCHMRNVEYRHSRKCYMKNVTYSLYIGYMIYVTCTL